ITGGLGGIGTCLSEFLLREYGARLVLVGRTALPERSQWGQLADGTVLARRVGNYLKLEATRGELMYQAADVCDLPSLQRAVAAAESRWGGRISGIFHLAGEVD